MKKSELKQLIKEELKQALGEQTNPELDRFVKNMVRGLEQKYSYGEQDALYAIFESLKRQGMLANDVNYRPK